MTKMNIDDAISLFKAPKDTKLGPVMPEVTAAVETAAKADEIDKIRSLLDAIETAYNNTNPEEDEVTKTRYGHDNFLTIAYLADHPEIEKFQKIGVPSFYADESLYGPAMKIAKKILDERGVDIKDVFVDQDFPMN